MTKSNKFSPEVRERAVRMVQEHRTDYPSLWAAIESIAPKIGCVPQTLNDWVKKAEVDSGQRPGTTTADAQRIKELEREVNGARLGLLAHTLEHRLDDLELLAARIAGVFLASHLVIVCGQPKIVNTF